MSKREKYEPGTFSWTDLQTENEPAARDFYKGLFGWELDPMPMDGGSVYTMATVEGDSVAALSELQDELKERGVPPHWNSYITVDSADEAAKKAKEAGAQVYGEPFDVMDVGRMAVIQDPVGAMVCLWEPKRHIGAARVNEPGALAWNELHTRDVDGAIKFYGELFGWEAKPMDMNGSTYTMLENNGRANGGVFEGAAQEGQPGWWLPYIACKDVKDAVAYTRDNGGEVVLDPMSIGMGDIAVIRDPQGAHLGLFSGPME